jgi:bifunctional enzyme CysN/CysC
VLIHTVTNNTVAVGMILDKLESKNLPSRISDTDKEKIKKGNSLIPTESRQARLNQKGVTLWFTGLHGSGKNELAFSLEKKLFENGATAVLLDGSSLRSGLNRGLDFSPADRAEQLRRVAHICKLLNDQGIITICSFISHIRSLREQIAEIIGKDKFHLFYMDAPIDYCKKNKPDLYKFFDQGKTQGLPGADLKYEIPANAKLIFYPDQSEENLELLRDYLAKQKIYPVK